MKTSILAQVSALAGGVGSHVVNHPNPTHDLFSKIKRMKAFGPATVVHGREQYSRSVQDYEAPPPCADTVGWVDVFGLGCDWYAVNDELGCPDWGHTSDGGMGVPADNCCYCAGTSEDDTTAATTTTSSTSAPEVDDPCIISRIHFHCTTLGHAGKNGNLAVLFLCHVQAASAPADGALPFLMPTATIGALSPSAPVFS